MQLFFQGSPSFPQSAMSCLPLLLLLTLLGAAVWHDVRRRRIPNAVVFPGALAGLALHTLLPAGAGLFGTPMGGLGFHDSLGGLALGLVVLLPMYVLRTIGAGDVKLLAMAGAFVGTAQVPLLVLATLVSGGLLALTHAASQGQLHSLLRNTWHMLIFTCMSSLAGRPMVAPPRSTSSRLPYGIAIAAASTLCALRLRTGVTLAL